MIEGLVEQFATLGDPRCAGKVEHRLVDVLVIIVCAVIAGAETFEDVALYGRCKQAWLRGFLGLPGGIPSHDTFRRVLMLIGPDAFERCFMAWALDALRRDPANGPEQIAVDGKVVRHSFDRRHDRSPLHLVSAYATERGLVLAQRAVDDKGGAAQGSSCAAGGMAAQVASRPRCPPCSTACASTAAWSALTRSVAGATWPSTSRRAGPTTC